MSKGYILFGSKITAPLTRKERQPGCSHTVPADASFCSICGRRNVEVTRDVPLYDLGPTTLGGLEVIYEGATYIGVKHAETESYESPKELPLGNAVLEDAYARVQAALEPLGLWDPTAFRVWLFVEGSDY